MSCFYFVSLNFLNRSELLKDGYILEKYLENKFVLQNYKHKYEFVRLDFGDRWKEIDFLSLVLDYKP